VDAVRLACALCQRVQAGCGDLLLRSNMSHLAPRIMVQEEQGLDTKKDRSLVTTADYAAQALISWCAAEGQLPSSEA